MKLGQILSMDTGDLLPQELADILATLRNAGYAMPDAQLQEVLADGLGPNFEKAGDLSRGRSRQLLSGRCIDCRRATGVLRCSKYSTRVLEKVSILTSITSLIATRIRVAAQAHGYVPLLAEAKSQLHEEADYEQEARYLNAFVRALGDDERFLLPRVIPS